jgi:hypothetical protein
MEVSEEVSQTGVDCFTEVENELNISLPICIKNLLRITGFTNPQLLALITDDDILEIEKFMAETVPTLIPKEEYESYFGIFWKKTENFKLIQGHRKLITIISSYFKKKVLQQSTTQDKSENKSLATNLCTGTLGKRRGKRRPQLPYR